MHIFLRIPSARLSASLDSDLHISKSCHCLFWLIQNIWCTFLYFSQSGVQNLLSIFNHDMIIIIKAIMNTTGIYFGVVYLKLVKLWAASYIFLCNESDPGPCNSFYLHWIFYWILLSIGGRIFYCCVIFSFSMSETAFPIFHSWLFLSEALSYLHKTFS